MENSVTDKVLQLADVVQIKIDDNIPKEIQGCLGYVMNINNQAALIVRVYQPKTIAANAEYSEYSLPAIALNFVGTVPADMQPL
jgi:hypothetical protein